MQEEVKAKKPRKTPRQARVFPVHVRRAIDFWQSWDKLQKANPQWTENQHYLNFYQYLAEEFAAVEHGADVWNFLVHQCVSELRKLHQKDTDKVADRIYRFRHRRNR